MKNKTIMLVDDDPAILTVYGDFLSQAGYEILEAADGREALSQLGEIAAAGGTLPGLIMIDYDMPVMNGGELIERLRQDARFAGISLMLNSSVPNIEQFATALGVAWLEKRATPSEVIKTLRSIFSMLAAIPIIKPLLELTALV